MFSIVIPLYNKEKSILNTLNSVQHQTYQNFEVILVNDGSTDKSLELAKSSSIINLQIIDQENQGVSKARNNGISHAKREWIVFLDGDDIWKPNHLETLNNMIGKFPNDKVFCTSFIKSNQAEHLSDDNSIIIIENYFMEVIRNNFFWTSVTCIHHSVFEKVGNFNPKLSRGEDMDLWTRIGRQYRFIKSNLVTAIYRLDAENRSDRNFTLSKSRVYNYEFKTSISDSELIYYQDQVTRILRFLILKRRFGDFIKLYFKHFKYLKFIHILKLKK